MLKRNVLTRVVTVAVFLGSVGLTVSLAYAGTCTSDVPMGAIAPARPIWCENLQLGISTQAAGINSWADDFNHGQSMASLNSAYVDGFVGNGEARHFQHNDHWMVDIESYGSGALIGAWMRPAGRFTLQADDTVVIEFEVATPIAGTRDGPTISDSWPEMVLSTAPAPPGMQSWGSALRRNGTYLYEAFPGFWTFGCRMQQSRHPICALYMDDFGTAGTKPSRRWEVNQNGGEVVSQFGGDPSTPGLASIWKQCTSTQDPDVVCRNHFRWEIGATHLKLLVNGVRFYEAELINSELNNILKAPGGFYVFFGDFAYRMDPGRALRFHWDHVAINPGILGGGVLTPQPQPTQTLPTTTPAPTPTPLPPTVSTPEMTVTFDDQSGHNKVLSGRYPSELIDWGTNSWYLSAPWKKFSTKSVSFNGPKARSAAFTFVSPRTLVSVQAYNGSNASSSITLSCSGNTESTVSKSLAAGEIATITTGWSAPCSRVTVGSTNGWDTNLDNLVVR